MSASASAQAGVLTKAKRGGIGGLERAVPSSPGRLRRKLVASSPSNAAMQSVTSARSSTERP